MVIGCHNQSELYLRARDQSCLSDHSCLYILHCILGEIVSGHTRNCRNQHIICLFRPRPHRIEDSACWRARTSTGELRWVRGCICMCACVRVYVCGHVCLYGVCVRVGVQVHLYAKLHVCKCMFSSKYLSLSTRAGLCLLSGTVSTRS